MKVRHQVRSLVTLAALVAVSGTAALAQTPIPRTPPRADTPRLMVQVFWSADKVAGPLASDDLRERLIRSFPSRMLWVIDRRDVIAMLEQSGYDTTAQLQSPSDEATLAKSQRADEYIRGRVVKEGAGYRVDSWIVLTRDPGLMQPLPSVSGPRADRAVVPLVKAIQEARKQMDNEKECMNLARSDKFDEAIKAADVGILEYPQATLARYCKLNVLLRRKAPDAAVVAMANEILAIDSMSSNALAAAADAQKRLGNVEESNNLLVRLWMTNPSDPQLASKVVDALAASGNYEVAKRVVLRAVAENPGDVALVSFQFRILSAANDFKNAIKTGEEMVQMDTSLADQNFFMRMGALYAQDSQPQKAVDVAARGTQKFPKSADLWQFYAQTLKNAGKTQESIAAARQALALNPKLPNGWTQIASAYNDLNLPDSALAALREAKAAGDDPDRVATFALAIGNRLYKAASALEPKSVVAFQAALPYLHLADSTFVDPNQKVGAKFLVGVSSYYVAQVIATGLQASKNCDETKAAQAAAIDAMIYTQAGGKASPENAGAILGAVNGLMPYLDQSAKKYCKK